MHALEVVGLHKRFGTVTALRDVSLTVDAGEVFGFLGPNGAGKTTTLRIAMDLVRAERGAVRLFGAPAGRSAARERVGYLPGELRLWGDLRGADLLDTFARMRPRRPPLMRERLLEALGLERRDLARRVKQLSHGTRQKLGLVIAMQHDPDLLLLDEPSNGLDPVVQRAFRGLLVERARAGRAVLLSSHVLSEVEAVCGRVAILRAGEVLAQESILTLRERMVRRARVIFRGDPPALDDVAGITVAGTEGRAVELLVRGDVNPLLRRLVQHEVAELVLPEPRLEDIFLAYYESAGARGD